MTYSESVHELAESYVRDNSDQFQTVGSAKQAAHELAIEIQATIEQFFFTQEWRPGILKRIIGESHNE